MDSKVNYIVVGLFVLLLGAALLGGILWFSTGGLHGTYVNYVTYMTESVSGLNADAAVRYHGVKVGRVSDIELTPGDPGRVRLVLSIDADTPIKTDTVATLEMQGLTGLMNVNLVGGSKEAKRLIAASGEMPVIPSKPSLLGQLNAQVEQLANKLNETSDRLNRLLSDQNQAALSQSLANLEKVTRVLASEANDINDTFVELHRAVHQTRLASEQFPETVQQFKKTADKLERMADDVSSASKSVHGELVGTGEQMRRIMPSAGAAVEELRQAAANMRRMSEQLERNPSILVYGSGEPTPGPGE